LVWSFGGWLQRQITAVKIREDNNGFTTGSMPLLNILLGKQWVVIENSVPNYLQPDF